MKKATIGKQTGQRTVWDIEPVTKVVADKTKYTRKQKHKEKY